MAKSRKRHTEDERTRSQNSRADRSTPGPLAVVLLALGAYVLLSFHPALRVPFRADDFLFLEKTRDASFWSLWNAGDLVFRYYRPWSREFSYWGLQRLFGPVELPFHAIALGLWLAVMAIFFAIGRRLAGVRVAAISTGAVAVLSAWGTLLMWIAGIQDLWMLAFALAALLAVVCERTWIAAGFLALALLSKEPAVVLPGIALAYSLIVARLPAGMALRRTAPLWFVTIVWAALHPLLGGRLWNPPAPVSHSWNHPSPSVIAGNLLLTSFNLDGLPQPEMGWGALAVPLAVAVLPIAALLAWAALRGPREEPERPWSLVAFGGLWALLGWLPLLEPTLPYHGYYALLGMFGAWLSLGVVLARWPWIALALVSALVVVRVGRSATPSGSLDSDWYLGRLGELARSSRGFFTTHYATFPPHSRIYLSQMPGNLGLIPGDEGSIVFQTWYRDTTLSTTYLSRYRPRRPGEPPGTDYFFYFDLQSGWREEQRIESTGSYAQWEEYAGAMIRFGRIRDALAAYRELATMQPKRADHATNVAACYQQLGDTLEAGRWSRRAEELRTGSSADPPR